MQVAELDPLTHAPQATPLLCLDFLVKLNSLDVLVALHSADGVLGELDTRIGKGDKSA